MSFSLDSWEFFLQDLREPVKYCNFVQKLIKKSVINNYFQFLINKIIKRLKACFNFHKKNIQAYSIEFSCFFLLFQQTTLRQSKKFLKSINLPILDLQIKGNRYFLSLNIKDLHFFLYIFVIMKWNEWKKYTFDFFEFYETILMDTAAICR